MYNKYLITFLFIFDLNVYLSQCYPFNYNYNNINVLKQNYEYAMISYCNPNNIKQLNLGNTKTEYYLKNNIVYNHNYIFYNNVTNNLLWYFETTDSHYIIYRGTEFNSIENWQRNIKLIQEPYNSILINCPNCYIHNGFNEMYASVTNDFLNLFLPISIDLYKYNKPINIIGHSLGGALSTILFLELNLLNSNHFNNIYLYTYGSPRVGNTNFTDLLYEYKNNSYRVVNNKDPIPHLPPSITKYHKYQHIHNEIWIVDNQLIYCNSSKYNEEDINCSYSLYKALNIYDHMNYFNKKDELSYMFDICL